MNEYEIMIKNLENRVTELEKQLFAGAVKTVEPVKWEPKGGYYYVTCNGEIESCMSTNDFRSYGVERATKEQAERTSVEMRKFNRLLALRDELCGDEVVDWKDIDFRKYYLFFNHNKGKWASTYHDTFSETITPHFTTKESAQKACDMLNSGEVEL